MNRVSRNDARWEDLGEYNTVTGDVDGERQSVSESELYPLKRLFLGGNMAAKLETIVDGPTLMLFFWKIHTPSQLRSPVLFNASCKIIQTIATLAALRPSTKIALLPLTTLNTHVPPPRSVILDAPGRRRRDLNLGSEVMVMTN